MPKDDDAPRLNRMLALELHNVLLKFILEHYENYVKIHTTHREFVRSLTDMQRHRTSKLAISLLTSDQLRTVGRRARVSRAVCVQAISNHFADQISEIITVMKDYRDDSPCAGSEFVMRVEKIMDMNEEKLMCQDRYARVIDVECSESASESASEGSEDDSDSTDGSESDADMVSSEVGGGHVINLNKILHVLERAHRREKNMSKETLEFMRLLRERESRGTEMHYFDCLEGDDKHRILQELRQLNTDVTQFRPVIFRLLLSHVPKTVKSEIMVRLDNSRSESEGHKFYNWIDGLLKIPFGQYAPSVCADLHSCANPKKTRRFLDNTRDLLDKAAFGHDRAKHTILQFIGQMIKNPTCSGQILGIEGPMGNGKTTLIQNGFSNALNRPFFSIPLGGASDASFLNGHSYTYEGSTWGHICDVLMKAKAFNPIIYMDELDKISTGYKGDEIVNLLIHMVDATQNQHFQDKYFGNVDIDLTGVTWVFSYNDASRIHPVLRDRIMQVSTSGFTLPDKLKIAHQFLVPSICREVAIAKESISIPDEVVEFIIQSYTREGGVRRLRELLCDIIRDVNLDELRGEITLRPAKRRRGARGHTVFDITVDMIRNQYLDDRIEFMKERIHEVSSVGRINGMYATCNGIGGIIPIETNWIPTDTIFSLSMTGNLGKVMQESTKVARTLAWSLLHSDQQCEWRKKWDSYKQGIHVHCPEGAMEKEGPSAGTALTVSLVSLLTGNSIRRDIAVTGEINLSGNVTEIGGLREKLYGAKSAGCKLVLFPADNQPHFDKITRECPELLCDSFHAESVKNIHQVLRIALITHGRIASPPPDTTHAEIDPVPSTTRGTSSSSSNRCRKRAHLF